MRHEQEEVEERTHHAALPPPKHMPEKSMLAAWETAVSWAGPPLAFFDLPDDDKEGDA